MQSNESERKKLLEIVDSIEMGILSLREYLERKITLDRVGINQIQESTPSDNRPWLFTTSSIAGYLGVSERTIRRYREQGILSYTQVGDKIWHTREDLDEMIRRNHIDEYTDGD